MKVQQDTINNFFSLNSTRFAIPVYQRNYTWATEHCAKLLEDIVAITKDKNKTHFMGTITFIIHLVSEENSLRNTQEYVIIDGQQRITTIMLLLKAMQQISTNEQIKNEITRFLSDGSISNRLRLKPIKRDREAFALVMEGRWNEITGFSNIKQNYHFFIKELRGYIEKGYSIEEIYSAFLRLKIVGIGLEKGDDDPQVVFESINATGVHLEGVDLIRNFLMMGEDSNRQQNLYDRYWKPLEECLVKESVIKDFIEAYLRIYYGAKVKKNDTYYTFKQHYKEHFSNDIEGLMKNLCNYSRIYQIFIDEHFNLARSDILDKKLVILRQKISNIVNLKFGVSYPFIMQLANDFEQEKLDFENFNAMLELLISYHARRAICNFESNALNKVTYELYKNLLNSYDVSSEGLERFLGQRDGREIFPNNERVKRAFEECSAYSLKSHCKFILYEIEKLINAEPPKDENLEIEHFYPQNPVEEWREFVGEEYERLESIYLHTFGNLSLSGQNQKLGNKPFKEKVELLLENGSLKLNEYFTNMDTWGIENIKERSAYLAEKFCEVNIFRDISKEYRIKPLLKTLADNLTNYPLRILHFPNGEKCNVKTGRELAKAICDYIYKNHKEKAQKFIGDENPPFFTFDETKATHKANSDGSISIEIGCEEGKFWFISGASLQNIGKNLEKFITSCNLKAQDFKIES